MRVAYVDSSVVARRYLPSATGHAEALALFAEQDTAFVTSPLTRVETSGALVRAARNARTDAGPLLAAFDHHVDADGSPAIVDGDQPSLLADALAIVRTYGIRALDALHIATALAVLPGLVGPGDEALFVSRDTEQRDAAGQLGLTVS